MKTQLFVITFLLSLNLAHSMEKKLIDEKMVWIGIEPVVLQSINIKNHPPFEFSEFLKNNRETFFKVYESKLGNISKLIHQNFNRCGGFRVLHGKPEEEFQVPAFNRSPPISIPDYRITQEPLVQSWLTDISENYMNGIITHLTSYKTRYYKSPEGVEALRWIGDEWARLTSARNDIQIEYYKYENHDQPTVILTIEGSEPELKNQIIILGGHGDSINTDDEGAESHAPGADDNAAGIAALSDILRIMINQNYKPKHTIQFMAYAAEEVGIQGSYELARIYRQNQKDVLGVMQFDGINYNIKKTFEMALISDYTDLEQNIFMGSLIDKYVHASWTWEQCGYGCSDHAAWTHQGYRASFSVEAINAEQTPYLHTAEDTFDKSNNSSAHATLFVKLGIAYLVELDQ